MNTHHKSDTYIPGAVEPSLKHCALAEAAARTGPNWAQILAELHSLSALAKPADICSVNAIRHDMLHDPISHAVTTAHSTLSPLHWQLSRHSMHSVVKPAAPEGKRSSRSKDEAQHLFWCGFHCNGGHCSPVQHMCGVQPAQVHLCQGLEERLLNCCGCRM